MVSWSITSKGSQYSYNNLLVWLKEYTNQATINSKLKSSAGLVGGLLFYRSLIKQ